MAGILKKFGILSLAFASLTSCMKTETIGSKSENAGLKGETKQEVLFEGGGIGDHIYISGDSLKSETSYTVENASLTVEGNFPDHSRLTVTNGKVEITGNVGDESDIQVSVPVSTHRERYRKYSHVHKRRVTRHRTVEDSLTYGKDIIPALIVEGTAGHKTVLKSNAGIDVGCADASVQTTSGWGRPVTIRHNDCSPNK